MAEEHLAWKQIQENIPTISCIMSLLFSIVKDGNKEAGRIWIINHYQSGLTILRS